MIPGGPEPVSSPISKNQFSPASQNHSELKMAGRPKGATNKDKPFAEALRMELASAGTDHKRLRNIASKLIELAECGELQAIQQIADRLDGKPAQTTDLTVHNVSAKELRDDELAAIATGSSEGADTPAVDPSQLN